MAEAAFSIKQVRGDWAKAERALKAAGEREMRKAIRRAISEETKPTRAKIKQSAIDELPQRGGLNTWAARTPSVNTDFRERSAGVRISMKKRGHDLVALNRGRLRHPLFGNRAVWYQQSIAPGFFTRPIEEDSDDLRRRIAAALDRYMDELSRKAS